MAAWPYAGLHFAPLTFAELRHVLVYPHAATIHISFMRARDHAVPIARNAGVDPLNAHVSSAANVTLPRCGTDGPPQSRGYGSVNASGDSRSGNSGVSDGVRGAKGCSNYRDPCALPVVAGQLWSRQRIYELMVGHERRLGVRFDSVLFMRPDLALLVPAMPLCRAAPSDPSGASVCTTPPPSYVADWATWLREPT